MGIADEGIRRRYRGEPRNFCTDRDLEWRYRQALRQRDDASHLYAQVMKRLDYSHHMSAAAVRAKLPGLWSEAFRFAVDRHPYEKVVSMAYWRGRRRQLQGARFIAYLDEVIDVGDYFNYGLYSDGQEVVVDEVVPYPQLAKTLQQLAAHLGVVMPTMPIAKGNFRKDRRSAAEILSADQKKRVRARCAEEFALFGWER